MPVNAFRLQNFMAFADTDWIQLRKLNLLFGRNSSGKSVIIRALRLLKQSLEANDGSQPLTFTIEDGVDVGSFDVLIHRSSPQQKDHETYENCEAEIHSEGKNWSKGVSFWFKGKIPTPTELLPQPDMNDTLHVRVTYSWDYDSKRTFLRLFQLSNQMPEAEDLKSLLCFEQMPSGMIVHSNLLDTALLDTLLRLCVKADCRSLFPDFPDSTEDQPELITSLLSIWREFKSELEDFLKGIEYIGPIRPQPERFYVITQETARRWQQRGLQSFLDYLTGAGNDRRDQKIDHWLQTMKLGYSLRRSELYQRPDHLLAIPELELDELGPNQRLIITKRTIESLRVGGFAPLILDRLSGLVGVSIHGREEFYAKLEATLGNSDTGKYAQEILRYVDLAEKINIKDLGYGASQILPVIVQSLMAEDDALVLIEQPELHLHPGAQADIADLFISSINEQLPDRTRRGSHPRHRQSEDDVSGQVSVSRRFLVETHSETLFYRCRVEIARTMQGREPKYPLKDTEFACYFVDRAEGRSWISEMLFDDRGAYSMPRPEGFIDFFGQDFEELNELDRAVREPRESEK
jgi:hypothetical protein